MNILALSALPVAEKQPSLCSYYRLEITLPLSLPSLKTKLLTIYGGKGTGKSRVFILAPVSVDSFYGPNSLKLPTKQDKETFFVRLLKLLLSKVVGLFTSMKLDISSTQ